MKKIEKGFPEEPYQFEDPYERGFADKLYENEPISYGRDVHSNRRSESGTRQFQQMYMPDRGAPMEFPSEREEPRPRTGRKRHRFLRALGWLLFILTILSVAAALLFYLLAKPAMGSEPLGAHLQDSCTILLVGMDDPGDRADQSGDRTDTIMLMNVNRASGKISLMSIPRDTKVDSRYEPHSINLAYVVNGKGEEGMDSLMGYVSECVGFRPDGYVLLELNAFVELVDLFGGVEFDVPMDMFYEDSSQELYIDLKKGRQVLNGEQAMGLVRFRYGYADADLGRVRVQRDFVKSALDQWASLKNIFRAPQALSILLSHSTTDLSLWNITWLARAVMDCDTSDIYMTTIPFYLDGRYVIIDASDSYLELLNTYFNPYSRPITWERLNIAK